MTRPVLTRAATIFFFAFTSLSCHSRRSPPPPVAMIPAVPPPPTATPDPLVSALEDMPVIPTWHNVQAIGVNDTSILISVDVGSPIAMPTTSVPAPLGTTPQVNYLVIDLARGCVQKTETFAMIDEAASRTVSPAEMAAVFGSIHGLFDDAGKPKNEMPEDVTVGAPRVLPIVNGPIFHEQFVRKQKLFADFGVTHDEHSAWSPDGTRAMFQADDEMYRSDDGIRFSVIDHNASYWPKMSNDGRLGLYRRCTHPCGTYRLAQISLGQKSLPRFITAAEIHDFEFESGQQSIVYARDDKTKKQMCIERAMLSTGAIAKVACEPNLEVLSEDVLTTSEDATMGSLETFQGVGKDPQLVIFDLRTGTRLRSVAVMATEPAVDGDGRVAMDDNRTAADTARMSDATGFHALGSGEVLAWDHQKRVVLLHRDALTDLSKCGIVTTVTPSP